jgi:hypothetical protein
MCKNFIFFKREIWSKLNLFSKWQIWWNHQPNAIFLNTKKIIVVKNLYI